MTATDELRRMLDERGIEHDDYDPDPRYSGPMSDRKTEWDGASFREWPNGTIRFGAKGTTPAQAIAVTVGRRDTMELWPEWEQVLFANVTDEVAQDNLNECVHELLEKAAMVGHSCASCPEMDNPDSYIVHLHRALEVADSGAGTCQIETTESWLPAERYHRCKRCGAFFAVLNASHDIPPRVCPNCGRRIEVSE